MAIVKIELEDGRTKTFSDIGMMIERNGEIFSEAIDPSVLGREYIETDMPIEGLGDVKYYSVDILASIGKVVGGDRYDAIKAALQASRVDGVPLWDMLISGMFVPTGDKRIDTMREGLVASGLLTNKEFSIILELAKSEE